MQAIRRIPGLVLRNHSFDANRPYLARYCGGRCTRGVLGRLFVMVRGDMSTPKN